MKIHVCQECWNVFGRLDAPWNDTPQVCPVCKDAEKLIDAVEVQEVTKETETIDTAFYRLVVNQRDLAWHMENTLKVKLVKAEKRIESLETGKALAQTDKETLRTNLANAEERAAHFSKEYEAYKRAFEVEFVRAETAEDQLNFQMDPLDPGSLAHENLMLRGALSELLQAEKDWWNNDDNSPDPAKNWNDAIGKAEKVLKGEE